MGKFFAWLAGRSPPPKPDELRRDLRLLERRLNRFERNIRTKREKALKSISKALKKKEMDIAKEYAKQAVLLERDLKAVIKLRGKVTNLLNIVERGFIVDELRRSMQDLLPIIYTISKTLIDRNIQEEFSELTRSLEELRLGEELMSESMEEMLEEEEVDSSAEKLLREIMVEEGIEEIPIRKKTRERKISKEEIEKLLREAEKESS